MKNMYMFQLGMSFPVSPVGVFMVDIVNGIYGNECTLYTGSSESAKETLSGYS